MFDKKIISVNVLCNKTN